MSAPHTQRQAIPVVTPEAHEVAACAIDFETKNINGTPYWRYTCPCGSRGVWHPTQAMAIDVAASHVEWHSKQVESKS